MIVVVASTSYRKNSDISPKFEMDLAPCARASALMVSVMLAIERRLVRRLQCAGRRAAPPQAELCSIVRMLNVDLCKTPHKDQVNRKHRGNNGEWRSQFHNVKCT